ncbi:hypothetical protein [Paraburkholderia sp. 35.1]|uniref:hypothetical protein n=1 Tax=Paraburkholderia sp. 35.1 TaxID=2991058 RepID=UPI003D1C9DC8
MDIETLSVDELRQLSIHPLAAHVPPSGFVSVRDAILNPVVLLDGMLVDGRGRVREAIRLGLPCPVVHIDPLRDDHPALVIARAMTARVPQPDVPVRAVVCARLVREILLRPEWLDRYDQGIAARLKKRRNLAGLLDACAISLRTYDRAHTVLRDTRIEGAVVAGLLPLKTAERLVMVADADRRAQFARMAPDKRELAIDRYFARVSKRRHVAQRSFDICTISAREGGRITGDE